MSGVLQVIPGEGYTAYVYLDDGSVRCMDFTRYIKIKDTKELGKIKSVADFQKRVCNIDGTLTIDLSRGEDAYGDSDYDVCTTHTLMQKLPVTDPLEPERKLKYGNYVINLVSEVAFYWGEDEFMRYYHSAPQENYDDPESDEPYFYFIGVKKDWEEMAEITFPDMGLMTRLPKEDAERFLDYVYDHEDEIKGHVKNLKVPNDPPAILWGDLRYKIMEVYRRKRCNQ